MSNDDKDAMRRRYYEGAAREQVHRENRDRKEKARKRGELPPRERKTRRRDWEAADDEDLPEREVIPRRRVAEPRRPSGRAEDEVPVEADALVLSVDRDGIRAAWRGRTVKARTTIPLAVGDEVELAEDLGALPRVVGLAPRRSVLARPDPSHPEQEKILAANVDLAICVLSLRRPALRLGLVDRFLVACTRGSVTPALVINKIDLCESAAELEQLDAELDRFRELGVAVFMTSATSGEQVAALRQAIAGQTCVLAGHSGVGKSSLLNALDPQGEHLTGRVREGDGKGRHTTVRSSLVELSDGTRLIDTPGVRAFGLARLVASDLRFYFPDILSAGAACQFNDCLHRVEPHCAVRDQVESGQLSPQRYESYLRLLEDLD